MQNNHKNTKKFKNLKEKKFFWWGYVVWQLEQKNMAAFGLNLDNN